MPAPDSHPVPELQHCCAAPHLCPDVLKVLRVYTVNAAIYGALIQADKKCRFLSKEVLFSFVYVNRSAQ